MNGKRLLFPTYKLFLSCPFFIGQRRPFAIHDSIHSCGIKSMLFLVNNDTVPFAQESSVLILCVHNDMPKIVVSIFLFLVFQNLDRNKLGRGRSIEEFKDYLFTCSFRNSSPINQIPRRQTYDDRECQKPFPITVQQRFERVHSVRIFQFPFLVKHFQEVLCPF